MSTKTMKILTTIATILLIISMGATVVLGADANNAAITPGSLKANMNTNGISAVSTFGTSIMGLIQVAGIVLAVVILMILGIKYMMGSAEEKAEYKKTMIPYLVGAVLIFAASTIANIIYNFATNLT